MMMTPGTNTSSRLNSPTSMPRIMMVKKAVSVAAAINFRPSFQQNPLPTSPIFKYKNGGGENHYFIFIRSHPSFFHLSSLIRLPWMLLQGYPFSSSHPREQHLGHQDRAICLLVVLQHGDQGARHAQPRAVDG